MYRAEQRRCLDLFMASLRAREEPLPKAKSCFPQQVTGHGLIIKVHMSLSPKHLADPPKSTQKVGVLFHS